MKAQRYLSYSTGFIEGLETLEIINQQGLADKGFTNPKIILWKELDWLSHTQEGMLGGNTLARISYRPELDGLRAVAVLAVVLFHLDIGITGGYVGVDVFFVISGFLITSIISADLKAGTFNLKSFWIKRLRRLAPASFAMLIGTLLVGLVILLPSELISLVKAQLAQVVLFANYHFAYRIDYFDPIAGLNPVLHSWSLAVEEHFYLLLPLLLCLFYRRGRRTVLVGLGGLLVLSLAYSIWQVERDPQLAFFLLQSRAWELLIGCCLACFSNTAVDLEKTSIFRTVLCFLSMTSLLYCFWSYDESTVFPGANAILPCFATAGLIYGTQAPNLVTRFLRLRIMVGIGLISYSLYLWHWPLIVFTKLEFASELTWPIATALVAASVLMGYLSWRFVEQPFRKRTWLASNKRLTYAVLSLGLAFVVLPLWIIELNGLPNRYEASLKDVIHADMTSRFRTDSKQDIQKRGLPLVGRQQGKPTFLIWGDSQTRMISEMVDNLCFEIQMTGYIATRNSTPPLLETGVGGRFDQQELIEAVLEEIKQHQIQNVIMVSRWSAYLKPKQGVMSYYAPPVFDKAFKKTIDTLHAIGVKVWVMHQIPDQNLDISRAIINANRQGQPVPFGISQRQYEKQQESVNTVFQRYANHPNLEFLPVAPYCFENGQSLIGTHSAKYYTDKTHLSQIGSEVLIRPVLEPVLRQIRRETQADSRIQ